MINVFSYHTETGYGRDAGYSVNGARRTTLGYDGATGRIATFNEGGTFTWGYLPGSHLKSSLTYPNGLAAAWSYEPARDLLTQVVNAQPDGTVISAYTYTNDLLGRRTSKNDEQYGYNVRDELISADEVSYAYDDIGNRTTAEGKSYTANNLNQYTAIDDFTPTYDLDGNQTTVKTATGIWQVEYNAENRPIRWTQGSKVITMAFDRLGRRVSYREMNGSTQIAHTVFLYNGYLCIQQLFSNEPWNVYKEFIWDPTEPVATRPLAFRQYGKTATFLMHDGNKNVTDVITVAPANTPVAHYDYTPFGAATSSGTRALDNPFRFSSEFADDSLALVYYNYRHYNPIDGRWLGRDPIAFKSDYLMVGNNPVDKFDQNGLLTFSIGFDAGAGSVFGLSGTISIVFCYSKEGGFQFGASSTGGGGSVVGISGSIGVQVSVSNARSIEELGGSSLVTGASGGELIVFSGDFVTPIDMETGRFQIAGTVGFGGGTPVEGHAQLTVTKTWTWCRIGGKVERGETQKVLFGEKYEK